MRIFSLALYSAFLLCITSCKKNTPVTDAEIPTTGMYVSQQYADTDLTLYTGIIYSTRPSYNNIQYTSGATKASEQGNSTLKIKLDIAVPPNATNTKRQPLVIFIHGGSFTSGNKEDKEDEALSYARSGYIAASVNYRLTPANDTSAALRLLAITHAVEDAANAIRFLKANALTYHIDTTRIVTVGSSAGGGISLINAVEFDKTDAISDFPTISSKVSAVISTGATLANDSLVNVSSLKFDATDSPVLLLHANPTDGFTGATWQGSVLPTQQLINNSGNECTLVAQPDMTHTVKLFAGGNYWENVKPFLWNKLRLGELL